MESNQPIILPKIKKWLELEEQNATIAPQLPLLDIPEPDLDDCCEVHISSECVIGRDHDDYGTFNGSWLPNLSFTRQTPYFQQIRCADQANITHHACPRVRVKYIEETDADRYPQCFSECNVSWVQE